MCALLSQVLSQLRAWRWYAYAEGGSGQLGSYHSHSASGSEHGGGCECSGGSSRAPRGSRKPSRRQGQVVDDTRGEWGGKGRDGGGGGGGAMLGSRSSSNLAALGAGKEMGGSFTLGGSKGGMGGRRGHSEDGGGAGGEEGEAPRMVGAAPGASLPTGAFWSLFILSYN